VRVTLFKDSQESVLQALNEAGISYEELRPVPGQVRASGAMVVIAQTAAIAGSIATVLVAWIKARASRKIILTLHGHKVVHLEGYTVEQVRELLPLVDHMTAIDTQPAEQSNNSLKR
jgi:Effector Associated Constant Component 1